MALFTEHSIAATLLQLLALLIPYLYLSEAQIGVCYGRNGDNLPSAQDVVNLYKSRGITKMRIYEPDQSTLEALKGSGIELILGVEKPSLQSLGANPSAATGWVQTNVVPYASSPSTVNFRYIVVGNEIEYTDPVAGSILPAMQNILSALQAANLANQIKVTTAVRTSLIADNSFPPSNGVFKSEAGWFINPILKFLKDNESPILVNVYPYFAYLNNQQQIHLDYVLFTSPGTVVTDSNGLEYQNLFDALLDTFYAALDRADQALDMSEARDRAGAKGVDAHVSESGFPSGGGLPSNGDDVATPGNAATYYQNLINHVQKGTPRRPEPIETYLFEMFDEDLNKTGVEQHFGLFTPDMQPKYQLSFN